MWLRGVEVYAKGINGRHLSPQFNFTSYSNIHISWTKELKKVTSKKFKYTVLELEYLICPVTYMSVVPAYRSQQQDEHLLL
jgi:hypothetical protein